MMECYRNLEEKIWQQDMCAGCGACAAVCPSGAIDFIDLRPAYRGGCEVVEENVPCSACYFSCPRLEPMEQELMGNFQGIYAAASNMTIPNVQSGGAVTTLLSFALREQEIDGVLLMSVDRTSLKPKPLLATTEEEIIQAAGSRYGWASVLEGLDRAVKNGLRKLAIVGTPCVMQSIHRIRNSDLDVLSLYRDSIHLTIGVFCSEIFYQIEETVSTMVHPWTVNKIDIQKGKAIIFHRQGRLELPLESLKTMPGCRHCLDYTSELADISAGNMGSPAGYTTLVIRSDTGAWIAARAVAGGLLRLTGDVDTQIIAKNAARKKELKEYNIPGSGGSLDPYLRVNN